MPIDSATLGKIADEAGRAVDELLECACLKPGQILVVGCSTSEVRGEKIGSAGSREIANAIWVALTAARDRYGINIAVQCCEHLNRALVVERETCTQYNLDEVSVVPVITAGGALATEAMSGFTNPVVVESIQAHAGIDIGSTLIGMHLQKVAVPVRLRNNHVGAATVVAARTRPKLIGGSRAVYG
ncbi:MAG: TIGR01440 family protein [Verrucomicrobiota bacterium]